VVCVAFDRGFLDDPPPRVGIAHLFEHVWFLRSPASLTLEWGETWENAIVLYHLCPPDEIGTVVSAVSRRLGACFTGPAPAARRITSALGLIELERRGGQERRLFGFPRREIAQVLRGDPTFDPTAAVPDRPELADEIARFPNGHTRAVCVAGPAVPLSAADLLRTFADAASDLSPESDRPTARLDTTWRVDAAKADAYATAWVLPSDPEIAAAAWVVGGLIERRSPPATLRWVSGRAVSPRGAAPVRGGLLYALAAGTGPAERGARPPDLLRDLLLPIVRDEASGLDLARRSVQTSFPDAAELAAYDALDLLDVGAGQPCGYQDVLEALHRIDSRALCRFADLLAASPPAELQAESRSSADPVRP
jgi:hypothetical protein